MRLYNIVFVCKAYRDGLNAIVKDGANGIFTIENWKDVRRSLMGLRQIKCLETYTNNVYNSLPQVEREKASNTIGASSQFKSAFAGNLEKLRIAVDAIVKLYDSLEMGEASSGLDIKIPSCNSLSEHILLLKDIDFITTQCPYVTKSNERIIFRSVDVGSQWLTFIVQGTVAVGAGWSLLNIIASLVNEAFELRSRLTLCKMQELFFTEEKLKYQIAEDTIKDIEKYRRAILRKAREEMENDYGELADGEERDKMEMCLERMAGLIDKGVEVYASIDTPKDMRALFPMTEDNAILPESVIKQIEQKKEE